MFEQAAVRVLPIDKDFLAALIQFIEDRLERLPAHSSYFLPMHDLTLQFEHWCEQNGHQPWSTRNFKKALKERGFEEGRQPNARGFINLKFK